MRISLLGLDRIGAFHAETITSLPVVEELVVADPVPPLVKEAAEGWRADRRQPEAVLASGVDGVIIAASSRLSPELIGLCTTAGLPALARSQWHATATRPPGSPARSPTRAGGPDRLPGPVLPCLHRRRAAVANSRRLRPPGHERGRGRTVPLRHAHGLSRSRICETVAG